MRDIIGASLSVMILEIILNLKLANDIGLNWSTLMALEHLGMSTIEFAFQLGRIQPVKNNLIVALITSDLMTLSSVEINNS